jgi:hypothetical protein
VAAYLRRLAGRLQLLFTTTAETLGQTTNFVRRRRKRNLEPQAEAFLRALLRDALAQALKIQPKRWDCLIASDRRSSRTRPSSPCRPRWRNSFLAASVEQWALGAWWAFATNTPAALLSAKEV